MSRLQAERVRGWLVRAAVAAVVLTCVRPAAAVHAQQGANGVGEREIELLRDAEAKEQEGDLEGAEARFRRVLESRPTALSALLGLERVLRMQGDLEALLPYAERLLTDDPEAPVGHQVVLRTLSSLNRPEAMEEAADGWIRATPDVETPYREIGEAWRSRGQYGRAVDVLERGREQIGGSALALDLGALYALEGRIDEAVREWSRAIGPEAEGLLRVRRRVRGLEDGGASVLPGLVDALIEEPTTLERRRAAAELAVDAGLAGRAEQVGREVAEDMAGRTRENFLVEMARRSDAVRLYRVAYWAYAGLLDEDEPDPRMLAIRTRVAELALAVGDTTGARRHYAVIERSHEAGSSARRQAAALRIELTVREGTVDAALTGLREFRTEFPEAPELDELAAAVASALLADGDDRRARDLLAGVRGPRSGVLRSRLALRRGALEEARTTLLTAAAGLDGSEATEAITLARLLGRVSEDGGRLIARAVDAVTREATPEAVELLVDESDDLDTEDRAVVLEYAAGLADRAGLDARADDVRRTIVVEYAGTSVAPPALLALARSLAERSDRLEDARELLTRLILEHPRSALVPQARRELDRLEGRIPNS